MTPCRRIAAFTIIELLVVVSIITLLISILLPAIRSAHDQAAIAVSRSNLRTLGTAHATYGAEWRDRQFTLIVDSIGSYGHDAGYDGANTSFHILTTDGIRGRDISSN